MQWIDVISPRLCPVHQVNPEVCWIIQEIDWAGIAVRVGTYVCDVSLCGVSDLCVCARDKFAFTHKRDVSQFPYCTIANKLTPQLTYASIPFSLCHPNVCPHICFIDMLWKQSFGCFFLFFWPLWHDSHKHCNLTTRAKKRVWPFSCKSNESLSLHTMSGPLNWLNKRTGVSHWIFFSLDRFFFSS